MPVTRRISRSSALSSDLDGDVVEIHASGSEQRRQDSSRKRKRAEPQQAKNPEKSTLGLQDGDSPFSDRKDTGVEVIDLGDTEDVPDLGVTEVEGNKVHFKGFQCVICMDDTSDLTVTHCGKSSCVLVLPLRLLLASAASWHGLSTLYVLVIAIVQKTYETCRPSFLRRMPPFISSD